MPELISVCVGQAGVRVGSTTSRLLFLEHGIQPDGEMTSKPEDGAYKTFFQERDGGKVTPRTLMFDLEPTGIDEVRTGDYRQLYPYEQLVSGKEDTAGSFSFGYNTYGKEIIDLMMDRVRKLAEDCTELQGFVVFHSVGGGTGSGLGTRLLERISKDYEKKTRLGFSIYPSQQISDSMTEPYNAILGTQSLIKNTDASVVLDNEAVYDICRSSLDIGRPCYGDINRLMAQVISSLTASLRFEGGLNTEIDEFQSNLVAFPSMPFLLSSYAPIISAEKAHSGQASVTEITNSAFAPGSMMAKCDPRAGKYMSCCLMYRGDVMPKDLKPAVASVKASPDVKFADWCPTGFKCGINFQPMTVLPDTILTKMPRSVAMVGNSTSIGEVFDRISRKFDRLYSRKAFMKWYTGDGMEEEHFAAAREDLASLLEDYKQAANKNPEE